MSERTTLGRLKSVALLGAAAFGLTSFGGDYIWSGGTEGSWSDTEAWTQNATESENYVINTANATVTVSGDTTIETGLYVEASDVTIAGNNYQAAVEATDDTEGSDEVAASNLNLGWLYVGAWGGAGELTFQNGNVTVTSGINIADAGNSGTLVIDGASVTDNGWTRIGLWNTQQTGPGALTIQNGGKLTTWQIQSYLNDTSTITLDNGTIAYLSNGENSPVLGNTTQTGTDTIYGEDGSDWQPVEQSVVIGSNGGTIEVPADTTVTVKAGVSGTGRIYKTGEGELTFTSGVLGSGVNVSVLEGSATFNGTYTTTDDFVVGSTTSASAYIGGDVTCASGTWTLLGNWSDGSACDATLTVGEDATYATSHFQRGGNVNSATVTLDGGTLQALDGWFLTAWTDSNGYTWSAVDLYVDTDGGTIACDATTTTTTTDDEGEETTTTSPVNVYVDSAITGSGDLTWTGEGTLYITGDVTYFTGNFVQAEDAGEIVVSQSPAATVGDKTYYSLATALADADADDEIVIKQSATVTVDYAKSFSNVTLDDGVELTFTDVAPFSGSLTLNEDETTYTLAFVRNAAEYVYVGDRRYGTGAYYLGVSGNFTLNGAATTLVPEAGDTLVINQYTQLRTANNNTVAATIRLDADLSLSGNGNYLYVNNITGTGKLILADKAWVGSASAVTIDCPVEVTASEDNPAKLWFDYGNEFTLKGALSGTGYLTTERKKDGSEYSGTNFACSDATGFTGTIKVVKLDSGVGRNYATFYQSCDLSNASVILPDTRDGGDTSYYGPKFISASKDTDLFKFGSLSGILRASPSGMDNCHATIEVGALGKNDTLTGSWMVARSDRRPNIRKVGTGTFDVSGIANANSYSLAGGTLIVSDADYDSEIIKLDSSVTTGYLAWTPDDAENPTKWTYTIKYYAAMIGDVGYDTVTEALEAAKDGETVVLTSDTTETVRYANENDITLDLNGYTLTSDGVATLCNNGTGTLTITGDGYVVNTANAEDMGIAVWARTGSIVINGGTFISQSNYEATVYVGAGTAKDAGATITINGGTFKNIADGTYYWNSELAPIVLNVWNSYDVSALQVYGGAFTSDPTQGDDNMGGSFVPDGYDYSLSYDEATGLYTVAAGVAKVGDTWYPTFEEAYAAAVASSSYPQMTVKVSGDFTPVLSQSYTSFYSITFVKASEDVGEVTIKLTDGTYVMGGSRYFFPEDATLELAADWAPWTSGLATGGALVIPEGVTVTAGAYQALDGVASIQGAGTIVAPPDPTYFLYSSSLATKALLTDAAWQGTLSVSNTYAYTFTPANFGNSGSTICFNGFTLNATLSGNIPSNVELAGEGLTLNGEYSADTVVAVTGALSGSGPLTVANTTSRLTVSFQGDASEFTGDITIDTNSKDGRVAFGSGYGSSGQLIYVDTGASVSIASTATWTADNVVILGELTVNGTLTVTDAHIWGNTGTGVIRFTNGETALKYGKFANSWNGTYDAAWAPTTAFNPNAYVNKSGLTLVMSNGFGSGGYFKSSGNSTGMTGILRLDADLTINNGLASADKKYLVTFSKITGDKSLTFFATRNSNGVFYKITRLDDFGGSLTLNKWDYLELATVNVTTAPESGTCVVPVTVAEGAGLSGDFALTVNGEAYGTLTYQAADGDNVEGLYYYEDSGLDPTASESSYTSTQTESSDAITDAKATVKSPDTTIVSDEAYADYFSYKATGESGDWVVTIDGFKDGLVEGVLATALVFTTDEESGDTTASVTVPAGLYYKIQTFTELGGTAATSTSGQSTGAALSVTKPGTTQGFVEVDISTSTIQ